MTSREEIREIAGEAAEQAVSRMLLALGVDASDPEAVIAMQADFKHLRSWRESTEAVKRHSLKAAVTVIVTAGLGAVLVFFGIRATTGN